MTYKCKVLYIIERFKQKEKETRKGGSLEDGKKKNYSFQQRSAVSDGEK